MSSLKMVSPESVGLDSKVLSNTRTYLEEQYVNPGKYVGTLTLVARKGEVAYLDALGLMDRENKKPMQEDAIFGSSTQLNNQLHIKNRLCKNPEKQKSLVGN